MVAVDTVAVLQGGLAVVVTAMETAAAGEAARGVASLEVM